MPFPPQTDPLEIIKILATHSPTQAFKPALDRIEQLTAYTKRFYFADGSIIQVTANGDQTTANFVNQFGNVVTVNGVFVPVPTPLDPGTVEPSQPPDEPIETGDPSTPSQPTPTPSPSPTPTKKDEITEMLEKIAERIGIKLPPLTH